MFAVRKINISNWRTPVVRQHNIQSVPLCVVYDKEGRQVLASSNACRMIARQPEMLKKL